MLFLFFGGMFLLILRNEGIFSRKKLRNSKEAKEGAIITELKPKRYGSKRTSHMELIVYFSDGTTYRDECNAEENLILGKRFWLDKNQIPRIVNDALKAHANAVIVNNALKVHTDTFERLQNESHKDS